MMIIIIKMTRIGSGDGESGRVPAYDHTSFDTKGHYVYVNGASEAEDTWAELGKQYTVII